MNALQDGALDVQDLSTRFFEYLPTLVTAIAVLVLGFLLARILSGVVQRLAERIGLALLLERTGLAEGLDRAQITRPPAELMGLVVKRVIQFGAVMYALDILGLAAAMDMLGAVFAYLPRVFAATVALVAGAMVAQFVAQLVQAAVASTGVDFHAQLASLVRTLLMVITVIFSIGQLGLETEILKDSFVNLVSLFVFGLALAFGLGARDVVRDLLAGYYARQSMQPGDRIQLDGTAGMLAGIGPTSSTIEAEGERVIVPNRQLTGMQVHLVDEA